LLVTDRKIGRALQRSVYKEGDEVIVVNQEEIKNWVHHTSDLIEAAYNKGEAQHFMNSDDYRPEKPAPFRNVYHDPYKYFVGVRLRRLDELIVRANELPVNPDFDPQEWSTGRAETRNPGPQLMQGF
jgi:hypothetical protein